MTTQNVFIQIGNVPYAIVQCGPERDYAFALVWLGKKAADRRIVAKGRFNDLAPLIATMVAKPASAAEQEK